MATILKNIGPTAALAAIRASLRTPLWEMPPADPWLATSDTILMRAVPAWA